MLNNSSLGLKKADMNTNRACFSMVYDSLQVITQEKQSKQVHL